MEWANFCLHRIGHIFQIRICIPGPEYSAISIISRFVDCLIQHFGIVHDIASVQGQRSFYCATQSVTEPFCVSHGIEPASLGEGGH